MAFFKRLFGKKDNDVRPDHKGDIVEVDSNEKDGAQELRLTYHPPAFSTTPNDRQEIRDMYQTQVTDDLTVSDIVLLFWYSVKKDTTDIPVTFEYQYEMDGEETKAKLLDNGYIYRPRTSEILQYRTNDYLKDLLRSKGLKVGGKKSVLIDRIMTEIPSEEIDAIPNDWKFIPTQKGLDTLKEHDYIPFGHQSFGNPVTPLTMYQEFSYLLETTGKRHTPMEVAQSIYDYNKATAISKPDVLGDNFRNTELMMYRFMYDDDQKEDAMTRLIAVLIYDTCVGDFRSVTVNLYKRMKELADELGITDKTIDDEILLAKQIVVAPEGIEAEELDQVVGLIHATLSGNDDEFDRIKEEVDDKALRHGFADMDY